MLIRSYAAYMYLSNRDVQYGKFKASWYLLADTPMSSAQVILNSLNGLFQMSEAATHQMLTVMEDIIIPESWESIDLIKQTEGLMCTTAGLSLTEELLFVHKAQAIVDFCMECRNLWKAFKLDFSPPDGTKLDNC